MDKKNRILLGRITGLFGVKGWVKVHSDTHPRENIVGYSLWLLGQPTLGISGAIAPVENLAEKSVEVENGRPQGKTIVAKLKGIETPEQAQTLIGSTISVNRSDLPGLAHDEYYWVDLIGFDVLDAQGETLGKVERLFETGANDVMVVRGDSASGNAEILVPWIKDSVILQVDMAQRVIQVDWDPDY